MFKDKEAKSNMLYLAVHQDVALHNTLKELLEMDALLSQPSSKHTTINEKRSFIHFFKKKAH
jgi:hypothetical protein